MKPQYVIIQLKAKELNFHVVLFIMLYMQVGSNSVCWVCAWNPRVYNTGEEFREILSRGAVYYKVQSGFIVNCSWWIKPKCVTIEIEALEMRFQPV